MKLQEILNNYRNHMFDLKDGKIDIDEDNVINYHHRGLISYFSIRDLLSPESGFMQAVFGEQWCHLYDPDYYKDNNNNEFEEVYDLIRGMRSLPRRKYHAMMCSILTDEEAIKYLEENIE